MSEDRLSETSLPLGKNVSLLEIHSCGLLAFDKPEGCKTHPNEDGKTKRCLLQADYDLNNECYRWEGASGKTQKLYILNRLDSPTSGVVLGATNLDIANRVRECFKAQGVEKEYYAVVKGKPSPLAGMWEDKLLRQRTSPGKLRVGRGKGLLSRTQYEVEKSISGNSLSLLKLKPKTGRTHQLRVQAQLRGHPIIGDKTYGDFRLNNTLRKVSRSKRLFLHAAQVRLSFEFQQEMVSFEASSALPDVFKSLLTIDPHDYS